MTDASGAPDEIDERLINLVRRHKDPDAGIPANQLAGHVPLKPTSVRDRIEELVKAGYAPIGNFGDGYFWITTDDEYDREYQKHEATQKEKERRCDGLEEAFNRAGPPTGRTATDGGQAVADVPEDLANAVDALVDKNGVEDAEADLQDRLQRADDKERVTAALGYLRRRYREVSV